MLISLARVCFFQNRKKILNPEIEPVVLHTINPINSTKWVTSFSWIFHFLLIDFSKKIFEIFFRKCLMPWGYVELCTRSNKKKTYFWRRYGFLCRMLGLKWDSCMWKYLKYKIYENHEKYIFIFGFIFLCLYLCLFLGFVLYNTLKLKT